MKKWIALGFAIIAAVLLLLLPNTPKKQYYHHQGHIFGTYYNIRYEGTEDLHHAIKQRLQEFDHSLSMFNPNSVISHINRNDSILTDSLFEAMYHEAHTISQLSGGAFDITVAPLVNAWGFGIKSQEPRTKSQDINLDSIKALVGYNHIRLNNHHLEKDDERITLDASAIAKGYACDVVADLLRENGCYNLLVDIGGEVVLQGVNDKGNAWRVGITRPTIDATGAEKELQEQPSNKKGIDHFLRIGSFFNSAKQSIGQLSGHAIKALKIHAGAVDGLQCSVISPRLRHSVLRGSEHRLGKSSVHSHSSSALGRKRIINESTHIDHALGNGGIAHVQ